jgi:hypothetical protein
MPITEPPVNATFKALFKLVLAALVVLTFALVATFIPIFPANAEQSAPTIKEIAIRGDESGTFAPWTANKTAATITK